MQDFKNEEYGCLLDDLIHDAFYTNTSNRGKIMLIRAYAEVIVRKILLIPVGDEMTLGKKSIREKISGINSTLLTNAVESIRVRGNASTHTQDTSAKTEKEVEIVTDSLFDLLAYLFIQFFETYTFGSNPSIVSVFSLLPPIIRYKVLNFLYEQDSNNIYVIWKLTLATLKVYGKERAMAWLDDKEYELKNMSTGDFLLNGNISYPNMYYLCVMNVEGAVAQRDKGSCAVYEKDDFESALPHYKKYGKLSGNSQDELEFDSMMEFLYLGRKENTIVTPE